MVSGVPKKWLLFLPVSGTVLVLLLVTLRAAPVHSLGWETIEYVELSDKKGGKLGTVSDSEVLSQMREYGRKGSYKTVLKGGYYFPQIRVWRGGVGTLYYVRGDSLVPPGGYERSIFVPSKEGFEPFISEIFKKYGTDE